MARRRRLYPDATGSHRPAVVRELGLPADAGGWVVADALAGRFFDLAKRRKNPGRPRNLAADLEELAFLYLVCATLGDKPPSISSLCRAVAKDPDSPLHGVNADALRKYFSTARKRIKVSIKP